MNNPWPDDSAPAGPPPDLWGPDWQHADPAPGAEGPPAALAVIHDKAPTVHAAELSESALVSGLLNWWKPTAAAWSVLERCVFDPRNALVVEAARALYDRDEPASFVAVAGQLATMPMTGGASALTFCGELAGIEAMEKLGFDRKQARATHLRAIEDAWAKRELVAACRETTSSLAESTGADALAGLRETLSGISIGATAKNTIGPRDAAMEHFAIMQRMASGEISPFCTGVSALDNAFKIMPGIFVVVAARPSVGKSALAIQMASRASNPENPSPWDVFFAGIEMTPGENASRMICSLAKIPSPVMQSPTPAELKHWEPRYKYAAEKLDSFSLEFYRGGKATSEIIDSIDRWFHNPKRDPKRPAVAIIDYLQIMGIPQTRSQTRDQAIGVVTGDLKDMARTLGVTIVLLCQLNRESEKRDSRRPRMSDMRESGNVEQDAVSILGLTRPFNGLGDESKDEIVRILRDQRGTEKMSVAQADKLFHLVEANILKQRGIGGVGTVVNSRFVGNHMTFMDEK